jgi:hypothetical protein
MRVDIQSKLSKCLNIQDLRESDVVYVLVQIGKIIEQGSIHENYDTLWFYRNWIAHPKIGSQTSFVKKLKERLKNLHIGSEIITPKLFGFVSFIELKNEIIRFYHQQVDQNLIPSRVFLESFKKLLLQVIADVPVTIVLDDSSVITIAYDISGHFNIKGPGTYSGSIRILE